MQILAKKLNIDNRVHFFDTIPHGQILSFLTLMDFNAGGIYITLYKYGASLTKINDYMLAGKPIIYAMGDKGNPVEKSDCGICCQAENIKKIAFFDGQTR